MWVAANEQWVALSLPPNNTASLAQVEEAEPSLARL